MYANQSSLCNHNKKFYNNKKDNVIANVVTDVSDVVTNNNRVTQENKKYNCSKCNKLFNNYQNRWKHEKICKLKNI